MVIEVALINHHLPDLRGPAFGMILNSPGPGTRWGSDHIGNSHFAGAEYRLTRTGSNPGNEAVAPPLMPWPSTNIIAFHPALGGHD